MINNNSEKGFTLIELIIVIAIISILASIAIPRYFNIVESAHQAHIDGVEGVLNSAVVLWASENYLESNELKYPSEDIVSIEYMTDPGQMNEWTDNGGGLWVYNPTGGYLQYTQTNDGNGYKIDKIYEE